MAVELRAPTKKVALCGDGQALRTRDFVASQSLPLGLESMQRSIAPRPRWYCGATVNKNKYRQRMLKRSSLALIVACACFGANAKDISGSCRDASMRLALEYEMITYVPLQASMPQVIPDDDIKRARFTITSAYSMTAAELERKWPGFLNWGTIMLLEAYATRQQPKALTDKAYISCLRTFGN